jgi:hypothetical protein
MCNEKESTMANENLSGASKENSEELSQASGNSATWDSIIYGQPTPANADTENYYNDRVESEPFYFDPDAEDISENFMKDPTDFTDVALVAKRKRIAKIVGSAVLIVVVLVGGGYFGLKTFMGSQETQQKAADQAAAPEEDVASPTSIVKPKTPLRDIATNAPAVETSKVTAAVVGATIVTSDNVSLTVANTKLTGSQIECSATLVTDFCLAARNADTEDAAKNLDIYFFKDAARSRIFENAENFKKIDVPGSLAAATMEINLVGGKLTPIIVVVAPNSSGFMVALPQGTSSEDTAAFAKNLTLS